jgi:Tol biopolymer transport system component
MQSDCNAAERLTYDLGSVSGASWSSDGAQLAFNVVRDGHEQIYRIDADGKNAVNLSNSGCNEFAVHWGPAVG